MLTGKRPFIIPTISLIDCASIELLSWPDNCIHCGRSDVVANAEPCNANFCVLLLITIIFLNLLKVFFFFHLFFSCYFCYCNCSCFYYLSRSIVCCCTRYRNRPAIFRQSHIINSCIPNRSGFACTLLVWTDDLPTLSPLLRCACSA